ncbi:hypothetical protein L1I30_08025 [Gillisia sp. M10.2A]|uniref:Outer membrane protein beta-barrel domain-containing protein n=1 Tax=Gillisia lutea TaxID=2909668 RepID=A0ABS9EIK0_9FLAO|nr:hypothetical protein [Gillisia lutea]MCF4101610.1 hypothetical protein [Gillisia lutea]
MKKIFLLAIFALGTTVAVNAQTISENAIGLRLGGSNATGAEVSYQRAVGTNNNRLEFDLGWRNDNNNYDAIKLVGLYQWVWNIDGGFNWYVGAGAGVASVEDNRRDGFRGNDGTYLLVAGDIGIEYNFDIPLQLSLDLRPEAGFNDYDVVDDITPDIALGIRYRF